MEKTRFEFIDRMKGIAILLVIIGHLIQFNNIDGGTSNKLFNIIYSFHMPLFFILSGYVASRGSNKIINFPSFINFLWKKVYTLIFPLFTWTLLVGKYFFAQHFEVITVDEILSTLMHPNLWFLQVLFEIQILFGLFCLLNHYLNKKENLYIGIIYSCFIFILPVIGCLLIDRAHFMTLILFVFFFFMGSFISKYSNIEKLIMKKSVFAVSLILFFVLVAHWSIHGNTIDVLLKVIISTVAFIALLHLTQQTRTTHSIIDSQIQLLGKESLAIYVMQFFLTPKILFFSHMEQSNLFIQFVLIFMIAVPIAYLCVLVHRIFEKSNILNLLLYGKSNKSIFVLKKEGIQIS